MQSAIGGAKAGWFNASWPLARLSWSKTQLSLKVAMSGTYEFKATEVVSLERHGSIPLLYYGIRIAHTNPEYPPDLIFWCVGSRERVLDEIRYAGFQPEGQVAPGQERKGMPWRWQFLLVILLAWNALFLLDMLSGHIAVRGPGGGVLAAVGLVFAACVALQFSSKFQGLALKPGRSMKEVQPMVRMICLISGIMGTALLVARLGQ